MEDKWWRRHFRQELLYLDYHDPSRFPHGPWRLGRVHPLYLAYRIALCPILVGTLIWGAVKQFRRGMWFIFITNWSYAMLAAYMSLSAFIVLEEYIWERKHMKNGNPCPQRYKTMPRSYKVCWVLYNISICIAFSITTTFWCFVYDPNYINEGIQTNGVFHIGNSVISLVDLLIGGLPSRLAHIYQMLFFFIFYIIVNVIYCALGGTDAVGNKFVYEVLDWHNLPRAFGSLGVFFGVFLFFYGFVLVVSGIRSRISKTFSKTAEQIPKYPSELIGNNGFG